jgi:hypothetical protein
MYGTQSRARTSTLALSALVAVACTAPSDGASYDDRGEPAAFTAEVLLDARDDGATLVGQLAPVLPDTDAPRVVVLGPELGGIEALDARFADGGTVVLGTDRVLRMHTAGGEVIALDDEVYGPLSVAGSKVAYVRGAPPDLELARADLRTGAVEALTHGMAPVWSPALSNDGTEIVFVSSAEGSPRLHRHAGGEITALPPTHRTPSAPTAPRWTGSTLIFEDESGVAVVDLDRGAIVHDVPDAHGLAVLRDGSLAASIEGGPMTRLAIPGGAR